MLAKWHHIWIWIGELMHVNSTSIGSHSHWFQWMWINLTLLEWFKLHIHLFQCDPHVWWMTYWIWASFMCSPIYMMTNHLWLCLIELGFHNKPYIFFWIFHILMHFGMEDLGWFKIAKSSHMEGPNVDERIHSHGFLHRHHNYL
jgi:hypothetical protein